MPARKFGPSGLKYENTEMVLQKNGTNEQQEEGKAIIQYIVNEVSASALKAPPPPSDITIANAESRMTNFIKYYKGIELVPEEEFTEFLTSLLSPLPLSFRICRQNRVSNNFLEGKKNTVSQSDLIRDYVKEKYLSKVNEVELDGTALEVSPLPWYPNEYAYHANFSVADMKKKDVLRSFNDFLLTETTGFNVLRQDLSHLLPPCLMDFKPNHKILDMCAAPGWMSAQISEQLYTDTSKQPDGFLICNDNDPNKFQWRWMQGTNCLFLNKDARHFPDLHTAEPNSPRNKIVYDRIICDVPCSRDGNMRSSEDLRDKWAVTSGLEAHKLQKGILKRGLELLTIKGQLLYVTTSLNPIENEAVVAGVLKEAKGKVELVDVKSRIAGFKAREGMKTWKVMSNGLVFYDSEEEAPDWFKQENDTSVFPPSEAEVASLHLDRCVRVLPHDNNSSAFFCAVFSKKGVLHKDFVPAEEATEATASGDASAPDKQQYVKPIRCNTDVLVTKIEWTTEVTNEKGETNSFTDENTFDIPEMTISACSYPKGKIPEKYVDEMLEPDDKVWQQAKAYYGILDKINPKYIVRRGKEQWPVYYYLHPTVKAILDANSVFRDMKKFKNFGLKIFTTYKSDLMKECDMIPSDQGINAILPYLTSRKIEVTKDDLVLMMQEKTVALDKLSEETKTVVEALEPGCLIFHYTPDGSEGAPNCEMVLIGWRNKTFIKDHVDLKLENYHMQRLCGIEPLEKKGAGGSQIMESVKIRKIKDMSYEESETVAMVISNLKPPGK